MDWALPPYSWSKVSRKEYTMKYIVHKRFNGKAICGDVNIPAMTKCSEQNGVIYCNGKPICYTTSENAHQYFANNDDGNGMKRGKLTQAIQKALSKRDAKYQSRWDKIWGDLRCQKYKRKEYNDYWLWNHDFFNAEIDDLVHIANLIGIKEKI